jgi:hypothetical protein
MVFISPSFQSTIDGMCVRTYYFYGLSSVRNIQCIFVCKRGELSLQRIDNNFLICSHVQFFILFYVLLFFYQENIQIFFIILIKQE